MPTSKATLGAAALAAVAMAGCGSSGPSKSDFAKNADAICIATNKAHPPQPESAKSLADEIAIRTDLDRRLKALKVPDSEKKDFAAYNAGTQRILAAIDVIRGDLAAGNKKKAAADGPAFQRAAAAREKIAVRLGFRTCGRTHPAQ